MYKSVRSLKISILRRKITLANSQFHLKDEKHDITWRFCIEMIAEYVHNNIQEENLAEVCPNKRYVLVF